MKEQRKREKKQRWDKWKITSRVAYINPTISMIIYNVHVHMLSCFSHVWLFETLWTVAHQATLSMEFSRQECWSGLPCPPPGDLPDPGTEPESLTSALVGGFLITSTTWEAHLQIMGSINQDMTILNVTVPINGGFKIHEGQLMIAKRKNRQILNYI